MPTHIEISPYILEMILNFPSDRRRRVEDEKDAKGVDDFLSKIFIRHLQKYPGIVPPDQEKCKEVKDAIADSLDHALVLIAFCENPIDIEKINKSAALLGRRHRGKITINIQQLRPLLSSIFTAIDKEFHLHEQGHNDKAMLRKKVTAALHIINESLNHRSTAIAA